MQPFDRDYGSRIATISWFTRAEWSSIQGDAEPLPIITGADPTFSGSRGEMWMSGAIPIPLDSDTLRLSISGRAVNARIGVEWCHAKKGKSHDIVWCESDEDGSFAIQDTPAIPTTASFHLIVEASADGDVSVAITECRGTLTPKLDVLINQVGYSLEGVKRFTVQANGPLTADAGFRVIAPIAGPGQEFVTIHEGLLDPTGPVDEWGRWYWRGDFTPVHEPNNYYIEATIGGLKAESPMFGVGESFLSEKTLDSAQRFFFWQRCGCEVPDWHAACHLDDCVRSEDGTTREAAGAWHDAGDYNKYNGFTPLSVYSLLYARERWPYSFRTQRNTGRDDILDEAIWGADYLRKVQDPKTGVLLGSNSSGYGYWGIPEKETDNRIGGDDDRVAKGESKDLWLVAAFAHLGHLLDNDEYIGRALAHWNIAFDRDSQSVNHAAMSMFAAHELGSATGDSQYDTIQAEAAGKIIVCQSGDDNYDGWFAAEPGGKPAYSVVGDGLPGAALGFWASQNFDESILETARTALLRYVSFLSAVSSNALDIAKVYTGDKEAWFFPIEQDGDWHVGQNSQYLSDAWAAILTYGVTGDESALRVALDQINWVLGRNPYGMCMLHGHGTVNPVAAHHRYNMIVGQHQGAVDGSVYNGIVRFDAATDIPLWDLIPHGTPRYECNEPWIPHNSYYLFAMSELAAVS
jgi:hypothetical protein